MNEKKKEKRQGKKRAREEMRGGGEDKRKRRRGKGRKGEGRETIPLGGHVAHSCTSNFLRDSTFLVFSQPEQKKL